MSSSFGDFPTQSHQNWVGSSGSMAIQDGPMQAVNTKDEISCESVHGGALGIDAFPCFPY